VTPRQLIDLAEEKELHHWVLPRGVLVWSDPSDARKLEDRTRAIEVSRDGIWSYAGRGWDDDQLFVCTVVNHGSFKQQALDKLISWLLGDATRPK
jgi:hypothetical protein